ncbi:uncharacterized protein LOC128233494 isoform X2 [Mya arenaria]|nr:uncharacterized protein LOC128233494 isoform X2 [Mya arenaria]
MNNLTCQATMNETDACEKFTICCQKFGETIDKQLSSCSSNWLETEFCYSGNVVGIRSFLKYLDNQNVRRAWTSSAFKDACQNNTSHSVFTTNKLNKCLRTIHENLNNTYALIEGDNCKWTKVIICNETAQTFELLENKTVSMDGLHCVTVDVQNGTRNFSIAHCSSYLPSVCLKVSREKDNYTERPNRKTTTKSRNTIRNLTTPSWNEEENVRPQYVIIASVPLTFLVVILILIACFQIRKSRKRLTERQRPNSVHNDTYNRERDAVERTEERYNRISDFDLTDFKPELPVRGQTNQISVLDDYSMPPDSIPQEKETGEYFVTYDDPIRSLVKQHNEDNNHLSETRDESLERKFPDDEHACSSTHTDESCLVLNKGQVEFNRFKKAEAFSLNRTARLKENISDKTKEANNVKCKISEKKIVSEPCISTRLDNNLSTDQTKISGSFNGIALQNRVSVESSNGYTDCISKRPIKLIKQSEDSDDYEDTSNVNPEQFCAGAKPKERLFVNHVCIDCLTPDHLKKLGIRIIPDKSAYTLYNFFKMSKRFSDTALELYVNTADLKRSECSEMTSKSRDLTNEEDKRNENDRKSCSENEHDKQRLKEERDYFKYPRKCSLRHANSYDILGAFSKRNDGSHFEHVYHKLADVRIWTPKHVKCRHGRHKST